MKGMIGTKPIVTIIIHEREKNNTNNMRSIKKLSLLDPETLSVDVEFEVEIRSWKCTESIVK